ncbi:MAG: glycosyltransferase family 9 protein [Pirellulales bacterium]|nr:glycosyltransferase family 9 protein [Pirellulales bacterium]
MPDPFTSADFRRHTLGRYRYTRQRWRVLFACVDAMGGMVFFLARVSGRILLPWKRRKDWPTNQCQQIDPVGNALRGVPPSAATIHPDSSERHGGRSLQAPASHSRGSCLSAGAKPAAHTPKRILLVQLDHLGDAVITTAMLPALRRRYPEASIEVLGSPWNREIFEASPEVDRVYVSRRNRFGRAGTFGWPIAAIGWGLRLRQRRFELAIDVRGEFPLALILWLSGARTRLGWNCGGGGFLLTHSPPYVLGRPEADSRLALLAEIGIHPSADEGPWRPRFLPSPSARETASRMWETLPGRADMHPRRIVLHVGSGMAAKQWPVEHWRELLKRIVGRDDVQVVLVGAAGDRIIARRILGNRVRPEIADWTGGLTIAELAAVLEQADLLVGADSGPAHLAAAVGTAVVSLFSGTNSVEQWQPNGGRVAVVHNPVPCSPCHRKECPVAGHPCMRGLTVARVLKAVEGILAGPTPELGLRGSVHRNLTQRRSEGSPT